MYLYLLLMFIAMLVHQRVHRMCLLFTHPSDLQFIANDISRRWVNFTNIYAQCNPLKSSQDFSACVFWKNLAVQKQTNKKTSPLPPIPRKSKKRPKKQHEQKIIIPHLPLQPTKDPTTTNRPQPTQPTTNRPQRLRGMVNAQKGIISGYGSGPKGVGKGDSGGTRLVSLVSRHHWGGVPCRFGTGYRVFIYIHIYRKLRGGNSNMFYFHPYLEKIPILSNIFQMG